MFGEQATPRRGSNGIIAGYPARWLGASPPYEPPVPAKNIYHDTVVQALTADGWTITHDPLTVSFGGRDLFVDLGAERVTLAAEKAGQKIAVEVQSFLSPSPVRDLQEAVGQYEIYRAILEQTEPERQLYLAVPREAYESLLSERFGQLIVTKLELRLIVFDEEQKEVIQWIESSNTA
jgi:XisH protein